MAAAHGAEDRSELSLGIGFVEEGAMGASRGTPAGGA
jgi:hypothetical protein